VTGFLAGFAFFMFAARGQLPVSAVPDDRGRSQDSDHSASEFLPDVD
jgi:hypothetical protein